MTHFSDTGGEALVACRNAFDRIIEQYEGWGVQCGVDFHALRNSVNAALAAAPALALGGGEAGYEHQRAIMEGERNESLQLRQIAMQHTLREDRAFEAGFTNGWERRAALAATPPASPSTGEPQP